MAVQITLEFTDEQWKLVTQHYQPDNSQVDSEGNVISSTITADELKTILFNNLQKRVIHNIREAKIQQATVDIEKSFDV